MLIVNFSNVCIIYAEIFEKMLIGGFEVSYSICAQIRHCKTTSVEQTCNFSRLSVHPIYNERLLDLRNCNPFFIIVFI